MKKLITDVLAFTGFWLLFLLLLPFVVLGIIDGVRMSYKPTDKDGGSGT